MQAQLLFVAVCKQTQDLNVEPADGDQHREGVEVLKILRQTLIDALLDVVKIEHEIHGGNGANNE